MDRPGGLSYLLHPQRSIFANGDVTVERRGFDALDFTAGLWPGNLDPLHFGGLACAEHFAGVVGGEVTAPVVLQPGTRNAAGSPADSRADRIAVGASSFEFEPEPVVPVA